jgi:hypothetical protein
LFYAKSDQIISAERNIRAAAELISAEIRMAAPEDLVAATPDSVSLRYDVLRGVVCDSTAPDEVAGFVLDTVGAFGLSTAVQGWAYSEPYDSAFVYADGFAGTVTGTGSGPKTVCTGLYGQRGAQHPPERLLQDPVGLAGGFRRSARPWLLRAGLPAINLSLRAVRVRQR